MLPTRAPLPAASGDEVVDFSEFHLHWGFLHAFQIRGHTEGCVLRKPGSVNGIDCRIEDCKGVATSAPPLLAPLSPHLAPRLLAPLDVPRG